MSNVRLPFSVVAGALFSAALFLALYQFVNVPMHFASAVVVDQFGYRPQRPYIPVEITRPKKIERPTARAVAGSSTRIVADPVGVDRTELVRTAFELPGTSIELPRGHGGGTVGVDRDVIPVVRMTPDYPPHAAGKNIEGWVQIQFNVTAAGTVRDPVVVASEPPGEFEDAAVKAIARWRYNPRIDGGVAVERVGLQTVIRFELNK
jgi:protein TonB